MVIKYPGTKSRIADWIVEQFPENYTEMVYVEPYFGSGSIFWKKKPSKIETINDIDGEIVNLFRQVRDNRDKLIEAISLTPWSRQEYYEARDKTDDALEQARRTLIKAWISRGACGLIYRNGVRFRKKSSCGNMYKFLPERIRFAAERLMIPGPSGGPVQIENLDAIELMKRYNDKNVLIYADPPYVRETRNKNKIYRYEYYIEDHVKLIETIRQSKAKIILSGYENEIYNEGLKGWYKDTKTTFDDVGKQKLETIWRNYAVDRGFLFNNH